MSTALHQLFVLYTALFMAVLLGSKRYLLWIKNLKLMLWIFIHEECKCGFAVDYGDCLSCIVSSWEVSQGVGLFPCT